MPRSSINKVQWSDTYVQDGTDGELVTWDSSGVPAVVSVGTSGQVLTSGGVGVAPSFQTAGGGWELLDSIELGTAGTSMQLSGFTAKKHMVMYVNIQGLASAVNPEIRFNSDTATNYSYQRSDDGTHSGGSSSNRIIMTQNAVTRAKWFVLNIHNESAYNKRLTGHGMDGDSAAQTPSSLTLQGVWTNASAQITDINVFAGANFSIGSSFYLYGRD